MVGDAELDALFATAPANFIATRNALARKAQKADQHKLAQEIRALRKPTMVVWLINQIARRHSADVAALLKAGKQLNEAALKGAGSAPLREANEVWRVAMAGVLGWIREIAGRAIDEPRIVATLKGAAADPGHAKLLARGHLTDELQPPGIEDALGALAKAPPPRRRDTTEKRAAKAAPMRDEAHRAEQQREAAKELRILRA